METIGISADKRAKRLGAQTGHRNCTRFRKLNPKTSKPLNPKTLNPSAPDAQPWPPWAAGQKQEVVASLSV